MSELESSNASQALAFAASRPGLILPANKGPSNRSGSAAGPLHLFWAPVPLLDAVGNESPFPAGLWGLCSCEYLPVSLL